MQLQKSQFDFQHFTCGRNLETTEFFPAGIIEFHFRFGVGGMELEACFISGNAQIFKKILILAFDDGIFRHR